MPTVKRSVSERGEMVLRTRVDDGALELRVNGVFVMDTVETSSERMLAVTSLGALPLTSSSLRVLIGGLGLGYTLAEVLTDERVTRVVVAEIEADLLRWHREGVVPATAAATSDPRTELVAQDVRRLLATQRPGSLDLILLDVDNGPGYLVYEDNAEVYEQPFLDTCRGALAPDGVVAVWSAAEAPDLVAAMTAVFGGCEVIDVPVTLGRRQTSYHLMLGRRAMVAG